jgi:peptidoglycan/xylan/chitin deacetylase (PgdA/CDA1 family)
MHDGGGDRSQTVAAVPRIVRKLRRRGYRIVTVPRLLADDPPPREQGPPPNF